MTADLEQRSVESDQALSLRVVDSELGFGHPVAIRAAAKRRSPDDRGTDLIEHLLGRFARVFSRKVRGQFNDPAVTR